MLDKNESILVKILRFLLTENIILTSKHVKIFLKFDTVLN